METQYTKRFLFEKIVTFPYYINYLLGFIIVVPLCFLYGVVGLRYFGLWGLVVTFFIAGLIVISLIKYLSKSISIYFDEYYMYMVYDGNKTEKILKKDIEGLYSYNYEKLKNHLFHSKYF